MPASDELPHVSITLSPTQVEQVLLAASTRRVSAIGPAVAAVLANGHDETGADPTDVVRLDVGELPSHWDADPRLSRSLLRGLALLTCFTTTTPERGIVEMATELDMSPSTAHRYAQTLIEIGLLDRHPQTRKYRLATGRSNLSGG